MKVGIIANPYKKGAKSTINALVKILGQKNITTLLEDDTSPIITHRRNQHRHTRIPNILHRRRTRNFR